MVNIPKLLVRLGKVGGISTAKDLIKHGCIKLDGEVITKENIVFPVGSRLSVGLIIKVGKRGWVKVVE